MVLFEVENWLEVDVLIVGVRLVDVPGTEELRDSAELDPAEVLPTELLLISDLDTEALLKMEELLSMPELAVDVLLTGAGTDSVTISRLLSLSKAVTHFPDAHVATTLCTAPTSALPFTTIPM